MQDKTIYRVCVFGPPCSGKTSVVEALELRFAKINAQRTPIDHYYFTLPEAWGVFEPFALQLIKLKNQKPTNPFHEFQKFMRATRITQPNVFTPSALKTLLKFEKFKHTKVEKIYLSDVYDFFGFDFLPQLQKNDFPLYEIIMAELVRTQLTLECTLIHEIQQTGIAKSIVAVSDGGSIYPILYPKEQPGFNFKKKQELLAPVFTQFGVHPPSSTNLGDYYDLIFSLQTLTVLEPSEYEQYYYSGPHVRLDPPERAREMQSEMNKVFSNALAQPEKIQKFFFPAKMSLANKVDSIYNLICNYSFGKVCL